MVRGRPFYSGADFEALGLDGAPQSDTRTLAHAWSAGATSALSEYILGVRPAAPGYARYLIAPQTGDLTWATGAVPTPRGTITVSWTKHHGTLRVLVTVPRGAAGSIVLPRPGGSRLAAQGPPGLGVTSGASSFRVAVTTGGSYAFTVTP